MDPRFPEATVEAVDTPHLDRLAREGMRFASGYARAANCTPTRRSIQFGMTPARQRGTEFVGDFMPEGHLTGTMYHKAVYGAEQARPETIAKYKDRGPPSRTMHAGNGPILDDLDVGVGQVLDALDRLGLADNNYVFFCSDNGGAPLPPQQVRKGALDRNHPLAVADPAASGRRRAWRFPSWSRPRNSRAGSWRIGFGASSVDRSTKTCCMCG